MSRPLPETGLFKAVPLDLLGDAAKLSYVLDRMVEHETEWSDFQSDPEQRRVTASALLARALLPDADVVILEVWRLAADPEVVGLIGFSDIMPRVDAAFHPLFFDGKLRNAAGKRELLLRSMDWAFQTFRLERLSVEIPETSHALVDFTRRKLGFRFEGEGRKLKQRRAVPFGHTFKNVWIDHEPGALEAAWGSRRYHALLKDGVWRDILLLSITRDEFAQFVSRKVSWASSSTVPDPAKPSLAISKDSAPESSTSLPVGAGEPNSSSATPARVEPPEAA